MEWQIGINDQSIDVHDMKRLEKCLRYTHLLGRFKSKACNVREEDDSSQAKGYWTRLHNLSQVQRMKELSMLRPILCFYSWKL